MTTNEMSSNGFSQINNQCDNEQASIRRASTWSQHDQVKHRKERNMYKAVIGLLIITIITLISYPRIKSYLDEHTYQSLAQSIESDPNFTYQCYVNSYITNTSKYLTENQFKQALAFWTMTSRNTSQDAQLRKFEQRQKKYFQQKYNISKYGQVQICVIVLSYMNAAHDRYKRNLDSIFQQDYQNFKVYYVDDASKDGTGMLVQEYIKTNKLQDKIKLYKNKENVGKAKSQYKMAHQNCKPGSIMMPFDGDDQLIGKQVFKFLSSVYQQKKARYLYTHSACIDEQRRIAWEWYYQEMSEQIKKNYDFRKGPVPVHLRSWLADLYLALPKEEFFINGDFAVSAQDVQTNFAMMEMAGPHMELANQIVYRYVVDTGFNHFTIRREVQAKNQELYRHHRKLPVYTNQINLRILEKSKLKK